MKDDDECQLFFPDDKKEILTSYRTLDMDMFKENMDINEVDIILGDIIYEVSTKGMRILINDIQNLPDEIKENIMKHVIVNESLDKYDE